VPAAIQVNKADFGWAYTIRLAQFLPARRLVGRQTGPLGQAMTAAPSLRSGGVGSGRPFHACASPLLVPQPLLFRVLFAEA
jgi:hypothetical protein